MKWKHENGLQNSANKQCQDKYKHANMSKQQTKQHRPSPCSVEAETVSTYRTLAWFSGPAMLRVTRGRWITIDSRQNLNLWRLRNNAVQVLTNRSTGRFVIHMALLFFSQGTSGPG